MENKNAKRFTSCPVQYLQLIGFEFKKKRAWMRVLQTAGLCNKILTLACQLAYLVLSDADFDEKAGSFIYMNYYSASIGKMIALIYNREALHKTLSEIHLIYPSVALEKAYTTSTYLREYILIEKFLLGFFHSVSLFFIFFPLILTLVEIIMSGIFTARTPFLLWYPFDTNDKSNWHLYLITYALQAQAGYVSAITILGLDLCLFSSLLQLCMHFDILNRNILQIEPDKSSNAEKQLTEQIVYHQKLLLLAERVNYIFTPSVLFSLLSSSIIICFTGFQLLGQMSLVLIVQTLLLLGYELKQVVITCYLGDKLIDISLKISDSVYEHKWYNGTVKYKRLVLMMLMRSQYRVALNIAGISDVSLLTLRNVMSISYKIFTVLKTGKTG